MKRIIFDHDGVIADSWDGINAAFTECGLFGNNLKDVIKHQIEYAESKPYHVRGGATSKKHIEKIIKGMSDAFDIMMRDNTYKLFDGFVDEIKKLENAKIALVSSNAKKHTDHCANISKLQFTHTLAFEDSTSKEEKIEWIARDWGVSVNQIVYVTDTLADVYELETFMPKKNIIGVAWGYCGNDVLARELPKQQILMDFSDIHKATNLQ